MHDPGKVLLELAISVEVGGDWNGPRFGEHTGRSDRSSERRETGDGIHQEKLFTPVQKQDAVALILNGDHTMFTPMLCWAGEPGPAGAAPNP